MTEAIKPPVAAPVGRKRFWKQANVVSEAGGYTVQLDGRPVRLPGRTLLNVESHALAEALAAEWQEAGQQVGGLFRPEDLPLTGIAGSMLERIPAERAGVLESLLAYAGSDLLCYRAESWSPLARMQQEQWDRWLTWCREAWGADLHVSEGLMPITQPPEALVRLQQVLEQASPAELAVMGVTVPALGSFVLGLAAAKTDVSAEELAACATLDEQAQMKQWGEDAEITDRIAALVRDVSDAKRFLTLAQAA
ncbi:MAG: ATP12 family chaperone protein [Acetobacter cibinongensis]